MLGKVPARETEPCGCFVVVAGAHASWLPVALIVSTLRDYESAILPYGNDSAASFPESFRNNVTPVFYLGKGDPPLDKIEQDLKGRTDIFKRYVLEDRKNDFRESLAFL